MLENHTQSSPSHQANAGEPHDHWPRGRAALLTALLTATAPLHAGGEWGYRLGETRAHQQANFCGNREEAMEVAAIFEKFGALTGYSALSNAPGCSASVRTFTPRRLLKELTLAAGEPGEYRLRIIEVDASDGHKLYLVTTRTLAK